MLSSSQGKSTITSPQWLPFEPPLQPSNLVSPQLDQLVKSMTGQNGAICFRLFWNMITLAIETMPYSPSKLCGLRHIHRWETSGTRQYRL